MISKLINENIFMTVYFMMISNNEIKIKKSYYNALFTK